MNNFLDGDVVYAAKRLLGCHLIRSIHGKKIVSRIVETEAYHQSDAASHSFNGKTKRNEVMFGNAGHAYVYFTYGLHYCMNIVTGKKKEASAVLIRSVEPIQGKELMQLSRKARSEVDISNGPAKLCQALQIDKTLNGHYLRQAPLQLDVKPALRGELITCSKRIGITKETNKPWRFYITNSKYVSKK